MLKKMIFVALAATTLAGPALADPEHGRGGDGHHEGVDRGDRGDRGEHRGWDNRGADRRDFRDDRRDVREDRRDDRRWDQNRYRWNGYAYPQGYGYRSWGIGAPIDRAYWSQRYWIGNWGAYRLEAPYPGTRWIRVGPDALLIRIFDGRVVRAVRGIYY